MTSLRTALREIRNWGLYKKLTAVAALATIGIALLTAVIDVPSLLARSNDNEATKIEKDNAAIYHDSIVNGGGGAAGGLVGRMTGGTIKNSTATGTVTSNNPNTSTGGLVGEMKGGTIIDSEADVDVRDASGDQEPTMNRD